ncbi:MAG TPA: FtsQ-type POTRA domain-containing protein [Bacillota bacterium]|nr:FtsQ-type POTRA domain-containing protein [Bacillota bacterium]
MPSAKKRGLFPVYAMGVGVLLLLLWQGLLSSPYLSVSRVDVIGHETLAPRQVEDIAGVYRGMSMISLRTATAEDRLLADHRVVVASVVKRWPNTVEISIEEDLGLAVIPYHGTFVEFDRKLRVVAIVTDFSRINLPIVTGVSLPEVKLGDTLSDEGIAAARDVIIAVSASLRRLVSEVNVLDLEKMYLYLNDGVRIEVGGLHDIAKRLQLLPAALYAYEIREFDRESVPAIDLSGEVVVFRGK